MVVVNVVKRTGLMVVINVIKIAGFVVVDNVMKMMEMSLLRLLSSPTMSYY